MSFPTKVQTATEASRFLPIRDFDQQDKSPFFNGRIPAEIRGQIFFYALTEYTKPGQLYPVETNQCRPGYAGKKAVTIAFLQTCRRVYLETYHLPPITKEHVFWHAPHTGPYGEQYKNIYDIAHERHHFGRLTTWQKSLVKDVHLFLQMYWLEQSFMQLCQQNFMQTIETIKLTIRRGDWWWCERGHSLGINAPRGNGDVLQMNHDMVAEKAGEVIPWNMGGWGGAFAQLKSIKELEMEFETSDMHKDQLVAIVDRAKTWRFPLQDGMMLSAKDCIIREHTWTKPEPLFQGGSESRTFATPLHDARTEPGMLLHVRSVKWKLAKMSDGRQEVLVNVPKPRRSLQSAD